MQKPGKGIVYSAIVCSMILWAFSFVWVKEVYVSYGPLTTIFFRLVISTILLLVFGKLTGRLKRPERKDFLTFLLLAFFEPFLYFMGESFGLLYVSSTMGAIIIATIPLFSPLAASRFYSEKLTLRIFIGIILSFIGVSIVVFDDSLNFTASPLGIALEFLAVFSAIAYTVVLKNLSSNYNPVSIIAYQNFLGIFLFLPFWAIFECKTFLNTPTDMQALTAILKLAVFASCMAFIFYTYSIKHLGINNASIFVNVIPVFTAIFAWYILGEELSLRKFTGIGVVISGLFIAQFRMKKIIEKLITIQQHGGR